MGVDRILQLKLVADVGEINSKMGQAAGDVGKVGKAFGQLKSFAVPIMADIALQGVTMVADAFKAQIEHAGHLRDAFHQLEAVANSVRLPKMEGGEVVYKVRADGTQTTKVQLEDVAATQKRLRGVADTLRDIGVSVGVGEDAKIVSALSEIVTMTGKLKLSRSAVEAIFDAMRGLNVDFDTAKGMVINGIILGRSRQMDALGISGDTAGERLKSFNDKFGTAAEDFAKTADGKWAVATAKFDGHMLNAAILFDQALQDMKGALVTALDNLEGIIASGQYLWDQTAKVWDRIAATWGPVWDEASGIVSGAIDDLEPILTQVKRFVDTLFIAPFRAAKRILGAIWKGITGDVEGMKDDVVAMIKGMVNAVIDLLNDLSAAFAFKAKFEIPSIEVPDPTQLLEGGTITIGGGTVDLSRGRLFDRIPRLADGGIVNSPTLALIGEGAHSEAVVPLDGRSMGNTYNIHVSAPASAPADVGRAVVEAIEAYERRAGASWRR